MVSEKLKSTLNKCENAEKDKIYWQQLEYLVVYGHTSMAAFRQLSTHIVPPRSNVRDRALNTWSKVWRWILIWAY